MSYKSRRYVLIFEGAMCVGSEWALTGGVTIELIVVGVADEGVNVSRSDMDPLSEVFVLMPLSEVLLKVLMFPGQMWMSLTKMLVQMPLRKVLLVLQIG